ncbi:uncharacterized protein TNCV_264481 [Trichonephila clavipes]|nr:uncharacterized protein TNCV_264481 [Trichonephila clavipes]
MMTVLMAIECLIKTIMFTNIQNFASCKKCGGDIKLSENCVRVKKSQKLQFLEEVTLTNSSDIIISGDGTWKNAWLFFRVGVCAVIGDKTGKCIDAEVMSSFCKGCDSGNEERGHLLTKKWKILHVKECLKTTNGSAGMMETVGMVRIFQRSLSHRSVRYTSYINGDSKTSLIYSAFRTEKISQFQN